MTEPRRPKLGDRSLFSTLEPRAYLNHAAISPPSDPVLDAIGTTTAHYARLGLAAFPTYLEQRESLRRDLATLIGAHPDEIGLVANTTTGVIDVATCFPWSAGDRVVVLEGEFPANVTPWQRAAQLHGLGVDTLPVSAFGDPDPGQGLEQLEKRLQGGVRVVAASVVQFQTGLRMPIAEIGALCRAHGACLFVDAIQACGVVPIDVDAMHIDALSCGSHKWLMGVEGAAFVYVRRELGRALRPHLAGWLSHEEGLRFLFEGHGHLRYDRPIKPRAEMFEVGAPNVLGFVALQTAVGLITELGVEAIFDHVQAYLDALESGLVERGFESLRSDRDEGRSGILATLPPPGVDRPQLPARLAEHGISVSLPDGRLRFAPHWPNAHEEIEFVLKAIDDVVRCDP